MPLQMTYAQARQSCLADGGYLYSVESRSDTRMLEEWNHQNRRLKFIIAMFFDVAVSLSNFNKGTQNSLLPRTIFPE